MEIREICLCHVRDGKIDHEQSSTICSGRRRTVKTRKCVLRRRGSANDGRT